jgi:hypothetical protein
MDVDAPFNCKLPVTAVPVNDDDDDNDDEDDDSDIDPVLPVDVSDSVFDAALTLKLDDDNDRPIAPFNETVDDDNKLISSVDDDTDTPVAALT